MEVRGEAQVHAAGGNQGQLRRSLPCKKPDPRGVGMQLARCHAMGPWAGSLLSGEMTAMTRVPGAGRGFPGRHLRDSERKQDRPLSGADRVQFYQPRASELSPPSCHEHT